MSTARGGANPWTAWPLLLVVLLAGGWVFSTASHVLMADLPSAAARYTAQRWAEGQATPTSRGQWERARADLLQAEAVRPDNPARQETLGNLHVVGSLQPWASEADKAAWLAAAQVHYRRAIELRPTDGLAWALLAGAMARAGDRGEAMQRAAEKALALGPNETHVHLALMALVLEYWDDTSPRLQDWAQNLYEHGTAAQREAINRIGAPHGIAFESDSEPRSIGSAREPGRQ